VVEDSDDFRSTSQAVVSQQEPTPPGCISIDEVDESFRSVFPYPYFNKAQSECFETAYHSDDNMVVSGKSLCIE
jgi:hypothetical protein